MELSRTCQVAVSILDERRDDFMEGLANFFSLKGQTRVSSGFVGNTVSVTAQLCFCRVRASKEHGLWFVCPNLCTDGRISLLGAGSLSIETGEEPNMGTET